MSKWWLVGLVLVIALVIAMSFRMRAGTAADVEEIRSNPDGALAAKTMVISFADRTLPVNYLREDAVVYIGVDGPWWRSFRDGDVPVSMLIKGETLNGRARVVLEDQAMTDTVFARLRPTAPEWLPDWANGKLVIIDIVQDAR